MEQLRGAAKCTHLKGHEERAGWQSQQKLYERGAPHCHSLKAHRVKQSLVQILRGHQLFPFDTWTAFGIWKNHETLFPHEKRKLFTPRTATTVETCSGRPVARECWSQQSDKGSTLTTSQFFRCAGHSRCHLPDFFTSDVSYPSGLHHKDQYHHVEHFLHQRAIWIPSVSVACQTIAHTWTGRFFLRVVKFDDESSR